MYPSTERAKTLRKNKAKSEHGITLLKFYSEYLFAKTLHSFFYKNQ